MDPSAQPRREEDMKNVWRRLLAAAIALAAAAPQTARAQEAPAIDTVAINALRDMAAYINSLLTFQISGDITTEKVLPDGQKIQMATTAELLAERPTRMRLTV